MKWYDVIEKMPPEGIEVLGYSPGWIDEFTPNGIRTCVYIDKEWTSAKWDNDQDCYKKVGNTLECSKCKNHLECTIMEGPIFWTPLPIFDLDFTLFNDNIEKEIAHLSAQVIDKYSPVCGDRLWTKHDLDYMFREGYRAGLKRLAE